MQLPQIVLLSLLLAHLLGDFPLQIEWIAKNKGRRIWPHLCHGLIHYATAWFCLALFSQLSPLSFYRQIVVVGYLGAHLLTDWLRCRLVLHKVLKDSGKCFLLDQFVHALLIATAAVMLTHSSFSAMAYGIQLSQSARMRILETATIYVAVIFGGGYLIRILTRSFAVPGSDETPAQLANAGLYVGWIERFLVITSILMQSPVLVGLILTGKSIARFPEFKEARFAEYFLIGTLLSISLSVLGGVLLLELLYGTASLK